MEIFEIAKFVYQLGFLPLLILLILLIGILSNNRIIELLEHFFNPQPVSSNTHTSSETEPRQEIECSNLYDFIRANAPMFTVIGITGTMMSLIPTFLDRIIGPDWKLVLISDAIGLLGLILIQIFFLSGSIFILGVAYLIIGRIRRCNFDQTPVHSQFGHSITRGDVQRLIFYLAFIPTVFSLMYFIMAIFTFQQDPMIRTINSVLILLYLAIIAFVGVLLLVVVQPVNWTNTPQIKTILLIVISIAFIAFFSYVFLMLIPLLSLFSPFDTHFNNSPEIIISDTNYSMINSSSLGFPLQAGGLMALADIDKQNYVTVHWNTNFGYFISADPTTNISRIQGPECISKAYSTVYWTYDTKDVGKAKPHVFISMVVENIRKKEFFNATPLVFSWIDNDTIQLKR